MGVPEWEFFLPAKGTFETQISTKSANTSSSRRVRGRSQAKSRQEVECHTHRRVKHTIGYSLSNRLLSYCFLQCFTLQFNPFPSFSVPFTLLYFCPFIHKKHRFTHESPTEKRNQTQYRPKPGLRHQHGTRHSPEHKTRVRPRTNHGSSPRHSSDPDPDQAT